jgi:hypothetical protein
MSLDGLTQNDLKTGNLGNGTKNGHKINDSKALLLTITSHHRLQVKVTPHDDTGSSNTRRIPIFRRKVVE